MVFDVAVNPLTDIENYTFELNTAVALNRPFEESNDAVVGNPESAENTAPVQAKDAQLYLLSIALKAKVYNNEVPSWPIALFVKAAEGPHSPNAS